MVPALHLMSETLKSPIRGQNSGHVISLDQSEVSIQVMDIPCEVAKFHRGIVTLLKIGKILLVTIHVFQY